jgi:aminopeptidase N
MAIIIILLVGQSFLGVENKQVFYPEAVRAESTHSYDVLHYLIDLDLPMTSRYLEGAVTISARSNENNLTMVDLHLLDLSVDSVKVDGVSASYNHNGETLLVTLPQPAGMGDSFDILVGYSGSGTGSMGYLWYGGGNPISYTLGCPFCTRCWMPCYDRMWDKADYGVEFLITVPDSYYVCANGELIDVDTTAGYATFNWRHAYPIAPYLIHFASSIFTTYSDWYHPAPAESVEIMYFFWPADSIYTATAFQYTLDMIGFYDSLYGEYPFERYGMVILSPFYYAGMEHQTMSSIWRNGFVGNDYYLLAHEMSHMWWGDMVTCFGWANVWLNEGFATYSDALYYGRMLGHQAFISRMTSRRSVYISYELANPHSMYDPPLALLWSQSHTYYKASWVLHMIRYLCGDDETWLDFMSTYRDSFDYGNASTDDANAILNQVLGGNYDWFFDEWVYGMGFPKYAVQWSKLYEAPNWRLILDIDQIQTIGPSVFHMPLPIGVDYAGGDTIITIPIQDSSWHHECVLPFEPTGITVDPETWIIQQNTVTGVEELVTKGDLFVRNIQTIGRAINLNLSVPGLIKVYDITGRQVYEEQTAELNYQPASAGVYHVIVGDQKYRVVVVK